MRDGWRLVQLGEVAALDIEKVPVMPGTIYQIAGVLNAGRGMLRRDPIDGSDTNYPAMHRLRADQLVMRKLTAWEGPITIVPEEYDGYVVSTEFPTFSLDPGSILPTFMRLVCQQPPFWEQMRDASTGTVQRRKRVNPSQLLTIQILLPPIDEQRRTADLVQAIDCYIANADAHVKAGEQARRSLLTELLGSGGDGWIASTLGESAEFINGFPFKPPDLGVAGVPVIRIKQLLDPTEQLDRSELEVPERCHLNDGDLVFSWSGTLAVRIWDRGFALLNQHLFRVVERPGVDRRWLALALDYELDDLGTKTHGTTMKHITKSELLPHPVLIPPMTAQQQIADLVDGLDDEIAAARRVLEATRYARSALLSELLSGRGAISERYDRLLEGAS